MKHKTTTAALMIAALGFITPNNAEAALIFGYTTFDATSTTQAPAFLLTGFTATLNKNGLSSSSTGGSSDGQFGDSTISALNGILDGTPGTGNNGYLNLQNTTGGTYGSATSIVLTNNTGSSYQFDSLLFDFMRAVASSTPTNTTNATIRAQYDAGAGASPIGSAIIKNGQTTTIAGTDYVDAGFDVSSLILGTGESITFLVSGNQSNMRLDNIALTGSVYTPPSGVPEPGSFLALGGILATGLGLRSRNRGPVQAA